MDTEQIIEALKAERERLSRAIEVLEGGSRGVPGRAGRASSRERLRGARHMSAAARARISAAQKKRWAAVKAKKAAAAGAAGKKK